jgi:hypothetical protein
VLPDEWINTIAMVQIFRAAKKRVLVSLDVTNQWPTVDAYAFIVAWIGFAVIFIS